MMPFYESEYSMKNRDASYAPRSALLFIFEALMEVRARWGGDGPPVWKSF